MKLGKRAAALALGALLAMSMTACGNGANKEESADQIKAAMEKDLGDLDQLAETGRFDMIKNWLDEKIFRCGAIYSTRELIQKATGGPLEAEHYIDYLRKKFSVITEIKFRAYGNSATL